MLRTKRQGDSRRRKRLASENFETTFELYFLLRTSFKHDFCWCLLFSKIFRVFEEEKMQFWADAHTGASTIWMQRDFTSPTRNTRYFKKGTKPLKPVFCLHLASTDNQVLNAGVYSQRAWLLWDQLHSLHWHGERVVFKWEGVWRNDVEVNNQSESFTVSEAGLAEDGPPVVKVILFKQENLKARIKPRWATLARRTGWRSRARRRARPAAQSRLPAPLQVLPGARN